jgi:hypothetical protein
MRPVSITIEVLSVAVICVTLWSLLVAFKSSVNLIAYDTCTPEQPEACAIGNAEACLAVSGNDGKNIFEWTGNWFAEIGEAIVAIPPKFTQWNVAEYLPENPAYYNVYDSNKPIALDIFDPGCQWCKESFKNQLSSGFLDNYNVTIIPYVLKDGDESRFSNSDLIVRYLEAVKIIPLDNTSHPIEWQLIERIFTGTNQYGVWQNDFINYFDDAQTRAILDDWLLEFGYTPDDVVKITTLVESDQIAEIVARNREIVEQQLKIVKIPTTLYDNKRHDGVYKP